MATISVTVPDDLVADTSAALVRAWAPTVGNFAGPLDGVADTDRIALVLAAIVSRTLAEFRVQTVQQARPELDLVALGVEKLVSVPIAEPPILVRAVSDA